MLQSAGEPLTGTRPQWWVSLCGGRSLVRSTPDIPWGNAQLENSMFVVCTRVASPFPGSGLSAAKEPRRDRCLTITDGHLVIAVLFEGGATLRVPAQAGENWRPHKVFTR